MSAAPATQTYTTPDPNGCCIAYLPRHKRQCGQQVKPGHAYCGNCLFQATGEGRARVPCPVNSNHHVPVRQLAAHLPKCTEAVNRAALRAQPYFSENLNAGADAAYGVAQQQDRVATAAAAGAALADATAAAVAAAGLSAEDAGKIAAAVAAAAAAAGLVPTGPESVAAAAVAAEAAAPFYKGTASGRQATAVAMGPDGFAALLAKIDAAHATLAAAHPLHSRKLKSLQDECALREQCLAFDPLMVFDAKHALQNASIVGNMAAAGLLQQPSRTVFLELGAGKAWLTAWVHMLNPSTQEFILLDKFAAFNNKADRRLRHVNLTRVAIDLKDSALLPLLQLHMSPPADLTDSSRCCAGRDRSSTAAAAANAGSSALGSNSGANRSSRVKRKPAAEATLINQGGLVSLPKRSQSAAAAAGGEQAGEQQQGAVPWVVCGKHLCGAAADFALRACLNALTTQQQQQQQQQQQFDFQGLAIASCCHHRCGWMSYTGRDVLQAAGGISKEDFEVIAWLTGWALCGHEAAPGAAQGAGAGQGGGGGAAAKQPAASDDAQVLRGTSCSGSSSQAQQQQPSQPSQAAREGSWHPANSLAPLQRIQLGLKCKQLLDLGRCAWLQETLAPVMQQAQQSLHGAVFQAQRVMYTDEAISGENTLLLFGPRSWEV